jgi:HlyD family secretion protein
VLARLDVSVLEPQVANLEASLEQSRAEADLATPNITARRPSEPRAHCRRRKLSAVSPAPSRPQPRSKWRPLNWPKPGALARAEVRAPADGIILTRNVEVGQTATPGGDALFRLSEGGEIELRGQVAEQDLPTVESGPGRSPCT